MSNYKRLLRLSLLGAPGSGKGTLAQRLIEEFDFVHISLGDIFRQQIVQQTEIGKKVKTYMDKGQLVPDELVLASLFAKIQEAEGRHCLFDGYPRNVRQAEMFTAKADEIDKERRKKCCRTCSDEINIIINIIVPDQVIIERLQNRWIHLPSGRVYGSNREPRIKWKDDITGEDLVQRDDDKPEIVRERLRIYSQTVGPVMEYYRGRCVDILDLENASFEEIWCKAKAFILQNLCD